MAHSSTLQPSKEYRTIWIETSYFQKLFPLIVNRLINKVPLTFLIIHPEKTVKIRAKITRRTVCLSGEKKVTYSTNLCRLINFASSSRIVQ